ncbi:MAG: hypothetical protein IKN18_02445, partial [Neisseriaceae bacterium]|nr:hypothetical protein [Neisseriaceae bacterium]
VPYSRVLNHLILRHVVFDGLLMLTLQIKIQAFRLPERKKIGHCERAQRVWQSFKNNAYYCFQAA